MTDARRGGPPSARAGAGPDAQPDRRLDGRLDLDHLDAPVDLDVIGSGPDGPTVPERVAASVRGSRPAAWARRHRAATTVLVVGALLAAGSGAHWWVARPEPLPPAPLVLVTTSGPDRTQVDVAREDRGLVALTVHVEVSSAERSGVAVALVSLTGPGLSPPSDAPPSFVDTTSAQSVARFSTAAGPTPGAPAADSTVSASLDCSSPSSTDDALRASPDQFGVLVRRTAPEGEVRVDQVPLVGAQNLALVVRRTCLQAVADRDLSLTVVSATPLPGVAAADVDVELRSAGDRAWSGLRVSTRELPWLVNGRPTASLPAGGAVGLRARVWLQDCADPSAALRGGLVLRTDVAPDDAEPGSADTAGNTLTLPVDAAGLRAVAAAFAPVCTSPEPSAVVEEATLATGGSAASAGTVDLTVAIHATGADLVEVDQGGLSAAGQVSVLDGPAHLLRGVGVVHAAWQLPPCADLTSAGLPRLSVSLVTASTSGGERRPYVVTLGGEPLLQELRRACGPGADAVGH